MSEETKLLKDASIIELKAVAFDIQMQLQQQQLQQVMMELKKRENK